MPGRREVLAIAGVGVLAAVAGAVAGVLAVQSSSGTAELLALKLPDLEGRPQPLRRWSGKVLLCNFWATWCGPCVEEMPRLAETQNRLASKGLQTVGIGIDQAAKMLEFSIKHKIKYPLLVGDASTLDLMRRLGNQSGGLPFTCVIDRSGRLVSRKTGALQPADLGPELERVLG